MSGKTNYLIIKLLSLLLFYLACLNRTSYWLLGWQLDINKRKLHRALDQDKINPQDEVWCVALRRNLLVCGTECGCIILFTNSDSEDENEEKQNLYGIFLMIYTKSTNAQGTLNQRSRIPREDA